MSGTAAIKTVTPKLDPKVLPDVAKITATEAAFNAEWQSSHGSLSSMSSVLQTLLIACGPTTWESDFGLVEHEHDVVNEGVRADLDARTKEAASRSRDQARIGSKPSRTPDEDVIYKAYGAWNQGNRKAMDDNITWLAEAAKFKAVYLKLVDIARQFHNKTSDTSYPSWASESKMDEYIDLLFDAIDSFKGIEELFEQMKHQGYDPATFIHHIMRKTNVARIPETMFPNLVMEVIVFSLQRGTCIVKASKKSKTDDDKFNEGLGKLVKLVSVYGFQDATPTQESHMTVARFVGCFPHVLAKLAVKAQDKFKVVGALQSGLPKWLHTPTGAALIPKSAEEMYKKWLKWSKSFTVVINRKKTPEQKKASLESVKEFGDIIWDSTYINETRRHAIVTNLTKFENAVNGGSLSYTFTD